MLTYAMLQVLRSVHLRISTGGMLTWGKGKEGHVMWVRADSQQYSTGTQTLAA
jgi:hypothetical protein